MKILTRLASWAETCAKIWAAYWLLIVGSLLVLGSISLKWIEFPFSRNVSGLELPVLHASALIPHVSPFSFGAIGLLVLLAGLLSLRFYPPALNLAAAVLMTLCVLTPAHTAFQQPLMLRRLVDELQAVPLLKVFTKDYFRQNYGSAEDIPKQLILYTAWGRFLAAWSFLRLGWYCFGIGSLLLAIYAIRRLPGARMVSILVLTCLPAGALAIVLTPPMIGQHYFTRGAIAKARGRNQEAITDYRKAMRWDAWHAQDIDLYAAIGQLQEQAGINEGSPERHVNRAMELREEGEFDPEIFELGQAAEAGGALEIAARRELAKSRISLGLALFDAGGIGGAVSSWQQALTDDPTQSYTLLYLARGYYGLARYEAALETGNRIAKIIVDHSSMLADVYSLSGDCYAKLGRNADARHYYNLSISADPILNYWALTGLIGE